MTITSLIDYLKLSDKQKQEGFYIDYGNNIKEYYRRYHSNGQLYSKGNYKNGNKEGLWEEYYKNGQLWYKGNCKNGVKID